MPLILHPLDLAGRKVGPTGIVASVRHEILYRIHSGQRHATVHFYRIVTLVIIIHWRCQIRFTMLRCIDHTVADQTVVTRIARKRVQQAQDCVLCHHNNDNNNKKDPAVRDPAVR
jgi:hypothetical protein